VRRWWRTRAESAQFPQRAQGRDLANLGVLVSGGVGDHIVAARFMRDLRSSSEPFAFDVFSANPGFASWIFSSVPGFQHCSYDSLFQTLSRRFDARLELSGQVTVRSSAGLSGKLLRQRVDKIAEFAEETNDLLTGSSRMDGFLAQKLQFQNVTRPTSLHSMAGIPYGGDQFQLPFDKACLTKSLCITGSNRKAPHRAAMAPSAIRISMR
jgi:hypothetical protein